MKKNYIFGVRDNIKFYLNGIPNTKFNGRLMGESPKFTFYHFGFKLSRRDLPLFNQNLFYMRDKKNNEATTKCTCQGGNLPNKLEINQEEFKQLLEYYGDIQTVKEYLYNLIYRYSYLTISDKDTHSMDSLNDLFLLNSLYQVFNNQKK